MRWLFQIVQHAVSVLIEMNGVRKLSSSSDSEHPTLNRLSPNHAFREGSCRRDGESCRSMKLSKQILPLSMLCGCCLSQLLVAEIKDPLWQSAHRSQCIMPGIRVMRMLARRGLMSSLSGSSATFADARRNQESDLLLNKRRVRRQVHIFYPGDSEASLGRPFGPTLFRRCHSGWPK